MSFCSLSREYLKEGYTSVDNAFFINYLPEADPLDVKVYLYGLFVANSAADYDNNISTIAYALKLDENRIMQAFAYWEEKGLVSITNANYPYQVVYHYVKIPLSRAVRYETRELESFSTTIYSMWPNIAFSASQFESLFELIKSKKINPDAAILIMKYYEQEKGVLRHSGVISMLNKFFEKGLLTEDAVSRYLDGIDAKKNEVTELFAPFGKTSSDPDLEMRELHYKWTVEYAFPMDVIMIAVKECKRRGGKSRLIPLMDELYAAKAMTKEAVSEYISAENDKLELAKSIVENLGVFAKYDNVVRVYINPWMSKGFETQALNTISQFCFIRGIRELAQMNEIVLRFHKKGLLTDESISAYVKKEQMLDRDIIEVLSIANNQEIATFVTKNDRSVYKAIIEWGFEKEAILVAASYTVGRAFPMTYISNKLSTLKNQGVFSPEGVRLFFESDTKKSPKKPKKEHDILSGMSKEDANIIIRNMEDINVDDEDM